MKTLIQFIRQKIKNFNLGCARYYMGPINDSFWDKYKVEDLDFSKWEKIESKPYVKDSMKNAGGF